MLYSQSQPSIPPVSRRRPSRMGMRSCWTGWKARPASSPCSSGWQTAWRQWVSLGAVEGMCSLPLIPGPLLHLYCLPRVFNPLFPASPNMHLLAAAAAPDEASREEAEAAANELRAAPKPLEALYNDYAIPSQVGITAKRSAGRAGLCCFSLLVGSLAWGSSSVLAFSCPQTCPQIAAHSFLPVLPTACPAGLGAMPGDGSHRPLQRSRLCLPAVGSSPQRGLAAAVGRWRCGGSDQQQRRGQRGAAGGSGAG